MCMIFGVIFGLFFVGIFKLPAGTKKWRVFRVAQQFDAGMLRVIWSNYQIVQSVRVIWHRQT